MSLQQHEKGLLSIWFALFIANSTLKSFRCARCVDLLFLYSKKVVLITLPLFFKKWVGYLNPAYFVDGIRTSHDIALVITTLIDSYSQGIFTFLFATVFN